MSPGQAWRLAIFAAAAFVAAAATGYANVGMAAFGCFYTPPIGGAKCADLPGPDPFRVGFYDALGLFSIPWTLMLALFLISHNRRIR